MKFPDDFTWGVASASHQVEGARDGRGDNVWDECSRRPGFVKHNAHADTACDHVRYWREDVGLMESLGVGGYRFSLSWPRILPEGTGQVHQAGLDFYDRLVDLLLEKGITPFVTLFHWDYPLCLYHRGGWLNPDSPLWFEEYVQVVCDRLSDRVRHWLTFNEPQCFVDMGHRTGEHAPGIQLPTNQLLTAAHHVLLAHGRAVRVLRENAKATPQIGFAPTHRIGLPVSVYDVELARKMTFAIREMDVHNTTWWSDPVFLGAYPADGLALFAPYMPKIGPDDMKLIAQPLDFYGVNLYWGMYYTVEDGKETAAPDPYGDATAFGWPITPEILYWGPKFLSERYGKPLYITENGMAGSDIPEQDGSIRDGHRISYLRRHLRELGRALQDGVDVRGYFHWTLMDNFEWAEGYSKRFGLYYVDFHTGARTPKESAAWYRNVIAENGSVL